MPFFLLTILFLAVLLGAITSMSRRSAPFKTTPRTPPGRSSSMPAAFCRADFFSSAERSFYEILRQLTPNHTIFAKVRLTDFVLSPKAVDHAAMQQIDRKQIDFVVCDQHLAPVVAIKFDDPPRGAATQSRDRLVEEVLAAIALPVIRLGSPRRFAFDEIHRLIAPYLRVGTPFI